MTRRIVFADIRLDLDDHPGRNTRTRAMNEHFTDQLGSDVERWPGVEGFVENKGSGVI
jgi:hypothetical protein